MSNLLISMCFGAGVAAFVYSRFGRRVGYGNTQNQFILCGVVFAIVTIIFYTIIATLPK